MSSSTQDPLRSESGTELFISESDEPWLLPVTGFVIPTGPESIGSGHLARSYSAATGGGRGLDAQFERRIEGVAYRPGLPMQIDIEPMSPDGPEKALFATAFDVDGRTSAALAAEAIDGILGHVAQHQWESVAISIPGTGRGRVDPREPIRRMVDRLNERAPSMAKLRRIIICMPDAQMRSKIQKAFPKIRLYSSAPSPLSNVQNRYGATDSLTARPRAAALYRVCLRIMPRLISPLSSMPSAIASLQPLFQYIESLREYAIGGAAPTKSGLQQMLNDPGFVIRHGPLDAAAKSLNSDRHFGSQVVTELSTLWPPNTEKAQADSSFDDDVGVLASEPELVRPEFFARPLWLRSVPAGWSDLYEMLRRVSDGVLPPGGVEQARARSAGGGIWFRTTATPADSALRADDYAAALAAFFRGAGDELCFGLFGPWGRGKTYLMDLVAARLREGDEPYDIVRFSAWKYPTTPQLWAHLYQSFAEVATEHGQMWKMPRVLRASLYKHGVAMLFWTMVLAIVALAPLSLKLEVFQWLFSVVGVAGLFLILRIHRLLLGKDGVARSNNLRLARHDDKLGLQALIGADLKSLLVGWIPNLRNSVPAPKPRKRGIGAWLTSVLITPWLFGTWRSGYKARATLSPRLRDASGVGWTLGYRLACFGIAAMLSPWVVTAPAPVDDLSATGRLQQVAAYLVSPMQWWLLGLAVVVYIATGFAWYWTLFGLQSPRKLLLVVDDLDRCDPVQMLEVAESLKLFLEDQEVKERVHIAMLIEESALAASLWRKYGWLATESCMPSGAAPSHDAAGILRQNIEKIFVAHLTLPPLTEDELAEVADRMMRSMSAKAMPVTAPRLEVEPTATEIEASPAPRIAPSLSAAAPRDGTNVAKAGPDLSEVVLTSDDVEAIKAAARQLSLSQPRSAGPRSVRCFVARYQLARALLQSLGTPCDPRDLTRALLDLDHVEGFNDNVEAVVRQVHQVRFVARSPAREVVVAPV